jgi:hypothetical protein
MTLAVSSCVCMFVCVFVLLFGTFVLHSCCSSVLFFRGVVSLVSSS